MIHMSEFKSYKYMYNSKQIKLSQRKKMEEIKDVPCPNLVERGC